MFSKNGSGSVIIETKQGNKMDGRAGGPASSTSLSVKAGPFQFSDQYYEMEIKRFSPWFMCSGDQ